ncbi:ClcB-like voltage-gated chloride channel protein [Leeia sp. TBRC 13508]|uniref:ClcB-like voltage-gated chloride channel protein n=1 Tax=Leeia speluncae TaxID=2884804 RepID=A0ABS8D9B1_9NEIS|nr:ClcB-like voltage-gated chloride channel protein [Leeia speluncae]MCB6184807.1 ClcB-like voltage-gated chloride channel protein [Leeia speluncae]
MRHRKSQYNKLVVTLCIAVVIGAIGALATQGFRGLLNLLSLFLYQHPDSPVHTASLLPDWLKILTPALGGILAGYILQKVHYQAGEQTDYMEAITLGNGSLPIKQSLLRAASSAISVVSGSSIGREASMIQLAALSGSLLLNQFLSHLPNKRLLVACGAAAGITAAYNTPIAAALFVSEIILQTITFETLAPLVISAAVAQLISSSFIGEGAIYHFPALAQHLGISWYWYALIGMIAGVAAPILLKLLNITRQLFQKTPIPLWGKLGVGGLIVGVLSVGETAVWGNGYETVNFLFANPLSLTALIVLLLYKVSATAVSTGSGAIGGIFTPSLLVGAIMGSIAFHIAAFFQPNMANSAIWIICGMGAFLGATTHAPLMAILMLFEMTQAPQAIVPLMLSTVCGFILSKGLGSTSVYARALPESHQGTTPIDHLIKKDPPTLAYPPNIEIADQLFKTYLWPHIYVTDNEFRFLGAISLHDFRALESKQALAEMLNVPDCYIRMNYPRIRSDNLVEEAINVFVTHQGERVPVIGEDGKLIGYMTKNDLLKRLGQHWQD